MNYSFLKDIAVVLGVAAVTIFLSRRLRLPSLLGYMVAGFIVGPYVPLPVFADKSRVESLSEFGVILVMFAVGLEFRIARLLRTLPLAGITAALQVVTMLFGGIGVGYLLGWTTISSLFLGGALAISSTMIVSKVFEENPPEAKTKDYVMGVLIIQDVVAIIFIAGLGTLASHKQNADFSFLPLILRLSAVFLGLIVGGLFIIPRFVHKAMALKSTEVTTIVVTGICFAMALLAEKLGYSVALGAFLAGVLVAEAGVGSQIRHLLRPLRDVFAAIFFVSIGMSVDPGAAIDHFPESLAISLMILFLQFFSVTTGGILSGLGLQRSILASISLGQIGEFAFIISAIGNGAKLVPPSFHAIIVTVAILTSLATPLLWRNSQAITMWIHDHLPSRMRLAAVFFDTWFTQLLRGLNQEQFVKIPRHLWLSVLVDGVLIITLPPLFLHFGPDILAEILLINSEQQEIANLISVVLMMLVLMPVFYGLVRSSSKLITLLSARVFSVTRLDSPYGVDPVRRIFYLAIQGLMLVLIGLPLLAAVMPFKESFVLDLLMLAAALYILWLLWKNAGRLEMEIASGGERIVEVLAKQTFTSVVPAPSPAPGTKVPDLPGITNLIAIRVTHREVDGRSLGEINLRAKTGATVVSIERGQEMIPFPDHTEEIKDGDIVHIWGSPAAKERAVDLLGQAL